MAAIRRFRPIYHFVSTRERCPKAVLVRQDDQEVLSIAERSLQRGSPVSGLASLLRIPHNVPIKLPAEGLEPTRPCGHWILSPARLPIPPRRLLERTGQYRLRAGAQALERAATLSRL